MSQVELDGLFLDRAMEQPYGARFLKKIETLGPVVRQELGPCWIWTAALDCSGYGKFRLGERSRQSHRLVCELSRGSGDSLCATHACDNRACCRPSHIRWATHIENMAEMRERGRSGRSSRRLTPESVSLIFELLSGGATRQAIADRFGIDIRTIAKIKSGENWSWLTAAAANDNATTSEAPK